MKKLILLLLSFTLIGFAACEQKGPAEKAGEKIDENIDNLKKKSKETGREIKENAKETGKEIKDGFKEMGEEVDEELQ